MEVENLIPCNLLPPDQKAIVTFTKTHWPGYASMVDIGSCSILGRRLMPSRIGKKLQLHTTIRAYWLIQRVKICRSLEEDISHDSFRETLDEGPCTTPPRPFSAASRVCLSSFHNLC